MSRPLVIVGAGGFAREVLQVALDLNERSPASPPWRPVGFAVEASFCTPGSEVHGLPVFGIEAATAAHPDAWWTVAVGAPALRRRLVRALQAHADDRWATLVHPMAWLGRRVEIAAGSIICAGCQVTTDIRIGGHVHANIGSTIGHDATLGNFVTLNPGVHVSGNVDVAEGAEIGTGSVLIPGAHVGAWSVVGAGSVVTRRLAPDVTAVGAPARIVKTRAPGWHEDEK
jgi:sugar O-acyltransferase (sialic acid O-acetyltransferase NeuD family)